MAVWLRVKPYEGSAMMTAAHMLRERGYYSQADDLDQVVEQWSRRQHRRFRVLAWFHLERWS